MTISRYHDTTISSSATERGVPRSVAPEHVAIDVRRLARGPLRREPRGALPAAGLEARAETRIGRQALDRRGEPGRVARFDQEPGAPVLDDFARSPRAARD